jgi:hypothetical protein
VAGKTTFILAEQDDCRDPKIAARTRRDERRADQNIVTAIERSGEIFWVALWVGTANTDETGMGTGS